VTQRTLHEELATVDEALAALEERRTNIVHRIGACNSLGRDFSKILKFPYRVTVTRSSDGPAGGRTKGSKTEPSDKG
jgi:hypothetical protein